MFDRQNRDSKNSRISSLPGSFGFGTIRMMKIATESGPIAQVEADALIVPVFEDAREERFGIPELIESGEVMGKYLELTLIHHPQGVAAKRVLAAGAGKAEKFESA